MTNIQNIHKDTAHARCSHAVQLQSIVQRHDSVRLTIVTARVRKPIVCIECAQSILRLSEKVLVVGPRFGLVHGGK